MAQYKVYWEMDIEADSPQEAAKAAREAQTRPDTEAVYFDVENLATGDTVGVDLLREED